MSYKIKDVTDKNSWDKFVQNYPKANLSVPRVSFVQSLEWLDFQKNLGRKTFALGIYNKEELVGICATVLIKAKRGTYIYVRNGPAISWTNQDEVTTLFNKLKKIAKENKAWFIRISPLIEKKSLEEQALKSLKGVPCPMHDVEALDTWITDISAPEDNLLKQNKKGTRYIIKKAYKNKNLSVAISNRLSDIDEFYDILKDTVKRQNWNAYTKEYIKKEFESFSKTNSCSVILIRYKEPNLNKVVNIAGGVFIHYANQTFYHYGATLGKYNNLGGAYLMIWEAIKLAKSKNHSFFNFWGISPENKPKHPWAGLTNFKKKFYGFEQRWTHTLDIPISKWYWITNILDRLDKYRKGY